jgi:RHS repeat-associated protein
MMAGGATDIAYLHNDHLGTPQAMTDAGRQVPWWRDQTPFGQTVATGGFSESPLRFPGQYADAESGLAYNYFRDYDPALGRYIQSDPIGLGGGLNTYGYVGGNPMRYVDPTGEQEILPPFFLPRPSVIPVPRFTPIPRPIDPLPPIPLPFEGSDDDYQKNKETCTKLYVMCIQDRWGGDWSCDSCFRFCVAQDGWPFDRCRPGLTACK